MEEDLLGDAGRPRLCDYAVDPFFVLKDLQDQALPALRERWQDHLLERTGEEDQLKTAWSLPVQWRC